MCGITGFFDPAGRLGRAEATERLAAMGKAISFRGPDAADQWVHEGSVGEVRLGLAHRRLSIVDLSPTGAQPMKSHCGRFVIAFNGEIYNHQELKRELDQRGGRSWRGSSDTEVLLELLAEKGVHEALNLCDGMFAFALIDRSKGKLILARDAFGEKPLSYGIWDGTLLFGSELSALKAWPGFAPPQDRSALSAYFAYSCIPAPKTIYEGILKLPPGHTLEISAADIHSRRLPEAKAWFDPIEHALEARRQPFQGDFSDAVKATQQVLSRSVARRQVADVPLGALLSGGIDSTLTTALMQQTSHTPVQTFTIGFEESGYDESPYAEAVAAHLGTQHQTAILNESIVLDAIPMLARHCDEPFADSSLVPTYLVSRMARQNVKVVLTGDGGDEMFAGYNRYLFGPKLWAQFSAMPASVRRGLATTLQSIPPQMLTAFFDRLPKTLSGQLGQGRAGEQLHKVARLLKASDQNGFEDALLRTCDQSDILRTDEKSELNVSINQNRLNDLDFSEILMINDLTNYLHNDVLAKVDRASMAVSLEARTPFLNREVMQLAWSMPMAQKASDGVGKKVLRELLKEFVPTHLMDRPKAGFALPIGRWLRGPLADWAESLLSEEALDRSDALNSKKVMQVWSEHRSGRRDHESLVWSILMYQSWREDPI